MAVKEIPEPGDLEHSRNKHTEDTITWLTDHGAKAQLLASAGNYHGIPAVESREAVLQPKKEGP